MIRTRFALVVAALLLAVVPLRAQGALTTLGGPARLKERFNAAAARPRLVLFMSPT